ncbi:MAG: hypothetical protein WCH99_03650 [Verrucomicrobiota bacterium]
MKADLPAGNWRISGNIEDVRMSGGKSWRTNDYSFEGHYDSRRFLLEMTPHGAEDDIAESVGKDGNFIYLIQRYSKLGKKDALRTESLAVVEPTVFSRYASHALVSVLMAFADTNDLGCLTSGKDIFLLGNIRRYPEENNTFAVKRRPDGLDIVATCYGGEERRPEGMVPIQRFDNGFKRWIYESRLAMADPTNGTVSIDYERFYPYKGKLFLEHRVTGKIILKPENKILSSFNPRVNEDILLVRDYRYRAVLFPLSKGITDQCYFYFLTNHSWDIDTSQIYSHMQQLREVLSRPSEKNDAGFQARLKDEPLKSIHKNKIKSSHRILILIAMAGFFVGFPIVMLLFYYARGKDKNKQTKYTVG